VISFLVGTTLPTTPRTSFTLISGEYPLTGAQFNYLQTFSGVPGRYANRIKNSTFEIDGETYHVTPNENGGRDTLHGGPNGWFVTIAAKSVRRTLTHTAGIGVTGPWLLTPPTLSPSPSLTQTVLRVSLARSSAT
jgi:hypothetical protein